MKWLRDLFTPGPPDELAPMRSGLAAMIRRALATGTADEGLVIEVFGCAIRGEPLGDWEFTVRRMRPAPVGRNPEGRDAQRLGAEHEHAVSGEAGQAPNLSRSDESKEARAAE